MMMIEVMSSELCQTHCFGLKNVLIYLTILDGKPELLMTTQILFLILYIYIMLNFCKYSNVVSAK
jgi:hypothetical protein